MRCCLKKYKLAVLILVLVALVLSVLSLGIAVVSSILEGWHFWMIGLTVCFIILIPRIAGSIVFAIWILWLSKRTEKWHGLAVVWELIAISIVFNTYNAGLRSLPCFILHILGILLYILAVVSSLRKWTATKWIISIAAGVGAAGVLAYMGIEFGYWGPLGTGDDFSFLCLHAAVLIYALCDPSLSMKAKMEEVSSLPPEQALRALQTKRDEGLLTEEEYAANRAEILRRL